MPLEVQPPPDSPDGLLERADSIQLKSAAIVIGLINNMPDSALESTEVQFKSLLAAAAGEQAVGLRLASLPEIARGPQARKRISACYWSLEQLWAQAPDAIIVTGTEPKAAVLSDEPYWSRLVELIEKADANLISSVWSCLAAHAAVLHLDGLTRERLPVKRFGVFDQRVVLEDTLTRELGAKIRVPHSRWNNLPADALTAAGYRVLTQTADADADSFVKQRNSLFVFFQGHPEYDTRALLKEYQRDVARFISGENREYPKAPQGYFGPEALTLTADIEQQLRSGKFAHSLSVFPFAALAASVRADWLTPAAQMYKNWLALIASRKAH